MNPSTRIKNRNMDTSGMWVLDGQTPVQPRTSEEWSRLMQQNEMCRVANDYVNKLTVDGRLVGQIQVSTVFLGIDHNYGDGPPLLFETMVFGGDLNGDQDRYSTWAEAEAGHAQMLRRVQATVTSTLIRTPVPEPQTSVPNDIYPFEEK